MIQYTMSDTILNGGIKFEIPSVYFIERMGVVLLAIVQPYRAALGHTSKLYLQNSQQYSQGFIDGSCTCTLIALILFGWCCEVARA